jgi:hypothetical protein
VHSVLTSKYSRKLSVQLMETKWYGAAMDLIIMLNSIFLMPQMLADGG